MSRRKVSWSDLPEELLLPIVDRLENRYDILHVRAVCKEWQRCVSLSLLSNKRVLSTLLPHKLKTTNPPLLKKGASLRAADLFGNKPRTTSLILVATSIFLIKPIFNPKLSPWVVTIEEVNPGKVFLRKPLSRSVVKERLRDFSKPLDLSRFQVEEMGKIYSLRSDEKPNHLFEEEHKVLLFVDPNDCKTELTIDDYTAFVLYDTGSIAAINLGTEKVQQVFLKVRKFDDIAMFKGRVYAIDRYGILYSIDKDNASSDLFKMVQIMKDRFYSPVERKSRLFESNGELYLVRKGMVGRPSSKNKSMGLRVYKMNHEENTWEELDSIGEDKILFVAPDCCFFARTSDFIGWKGNRIVVHSKDSFRLRCQSTSYFKKRVWDDSDSDMDWDDSDWDDYNSDDCFMESNEDKLSIEVYYFEDVLFFPANLDQVYKAAFWPPPRWLSTSDTDDWLAEQQCQRGPWWNRQW